MAQAGVEPAVVESSSRSTRHPVPTNREVCWTWTLNVRFTSLPIVYGIASTCTSALSKLGTRLGIRTRTIQALNLFPLPIGVDEHCDFRIDGADLGIRTRHLVITNDVL